MLLAIIAFLLSAIVGIGLCFFEGHMGIVAAISIMGAFIVFQNRKKS